MGATSARHANEPRQISRPGLEQPTSVCPTLLGVERSAGPYGVSLIATQESSDAALVALGAELARPEMQFLLLDRDATDVRPREARRRPTCRGHHHTHLRTRRCQQLPQSFRTPGGKRANLVHLSNLDVRALVRIIEARRIRRPRDPRNQHEEQADSAIQWVVTRSLTTTADQAATKALETTVFCTSTLPPCLGSVRGGTVNRHLRNRPSEPATNLSYIMYP